MKYEYCRVFINLGEFESHANRLGAEGWDMVAIMQHGHELVCIFKRQVVDKGKKSKV